ncbi:hypothetical protein GQ55_4G286900 [Panicum hallii var. hallii]|uniref:Uncharacterized protein n=1 Tax=Panicum hallii var. hallii TaxID=1504633 RepID=A0A2T7E167_9POAL|nr:hypothetical protein GQ55_4G286900 [Panicum hallii var. hallii]
MGAEEDAKLRSAYGSRGTGGATMWLPPAHPPQGNSQRRQDLTDDEQDKDQDEHREVAVGQAASAAAAVQTPDRSPCSSVSPGTLLKLYKLLLQPRIGGVSRRSDASLSSGPREHAYTLASLSGGSGTAGHAAVALLPAARNRRTSTRPLTVRARGGWCPQHARVDPPPAPARFPPAASPVRATSNGRKAREAGESEACAPVSGGWTEIARPLSYHGRPWVKTQGPRPPGDEPRSRVFLRARGGDPPRRAPQGDSRPGTTR